MSWNLSSGVSVEPYLSFDNAALKIEWAAKHFMDLNTVCKEFINRKPYSVSLQHDAEGTGQVLKIGMTEPIPSEIILRAGDIVGNLRAALDFAWMGLVRSLPTSAKETKGTLPIGDDRKGLRGTIANTLVGKAFPKQTELLLVDRIKSHGDMTDGGNDAINALNHLCNWNKHNLLILAIGETTFSATIGGGRLEGNAFEGVVQNIIRWEGRPDLKLDYDSEPSAQIVFGNHKLVKSKALIPTLANLCIASMDALEAFREVFPVPKS